MARSIPVESFLWPSDQLGTALDQLARRADLKPRSADLGPAPPGVDLGTEGHWLSAAASRLGVELEPLSPLYAEVEALLRRAAPAVLQVRSRDGFGFFVLLRGGRRKVQLLTPGIGEVDVEAAEVARLLRVEKQSLISAEVDALLQSPALDGRHRARTRQRLLMQRLSERRLRTCWLMRPLPSTSARRLARDFGLPSVLLGVLGAHALQSLAIVGSFVVLGRAALQARVEPGWLAAWALLLAATIPLRLLEVWWQGLFALRAGALLKRQLLAGILKVSPDEVRADGAGRHFGRVADAETVELLALGGGLLAVLSVVDLALSGVIMLRGAGGVWQVLGLLLWCGVSFVLFRSHFRRQGTWTERRIDVSSALLERLIGHRTRLAQVPREHWHRGEDESLTDYHSASRDMDRASVRLSALLPGGWLVVSLLGLAPAFALGSATGNGLAVAAGGMLLALRAWDEIGVSFQQISLAATSFGQIRGLLAAASREDEFARAPMQLVTRAAREGASAKLLEARALTFRYGAAGPQVIADCALDLAPGDRVLLEGPSGGGKSTLASLLSGLRTPSSGVLLLRGLDRKTVGEAEWRRRITAAPQFHENHVLTGTFAFNLLMGRGWPAPPEDLAEAREICVELGLGDLLEKMPGGLDQMIGESGWQLSHGERSRLFIARTLLQEAELIVLDESFAALDPETMSLALQCVLKRAPTLVVIAHP
jgi:ABC-type multidrug transport system fused ATPase/permease subunit